MSAEIWRAIPSYEGLYEVSNLGNVRSLPRVVISRNRWGQDVPCNIKGKLLSKKKRKDGYLEVCLCDEYNEHHFYMVHRLVAIVFIPNPRKVSQVNHINGSKGDNRVENLEWCNQSENTTHAFQNNLISPQKGSKRWNAIIDEHIVREIRKIYSTYGYSQALKICTDLFGVSKSCFNGVITNKTWKWVQ